MNEIDKKCKLVYFFMKNLGLKLLHESKAYVHRLAILFLFTYNMFVE